MLMNERSYDYSKLRGAIKEKYNTQERFAKQLNISKAMLSCKLNNHAQFTQDEIKMATKLLNIPPNEIATYFFA